MKSYTYKGDYNQVTIAGVMFEKDKPVHFNDASDSEFISSGIVKSMLENGELAEHKSSSDNAKKAEIVDKKSTKTPTVETPVKAD